MWEAVRKFGLEYCDFPTMLSNVSDMLRVLLLNVDGRNKKPIPRLFYIVTSISTISYFYVYVFSATWLTFCRCTETGDLGTAMVSLSLSVTSEVVVIKLFYMLFYQKKIINLTQKYLLCDARTVQGSRFSVNMTKALKTVKMRAIFYWVALMTNAFLYVLQPMVTPGQHLTLDEFIIYVNYLIKKWTNVRDYYMREKKRARNSPKSGVRKKKKYYFYDSLTFLDTITPKKRKRSFSDSQEMESNNTVEYLEDTSNDVSYDQCIVVEEGSLSESSRYIKQEDETMTSMPSFETHVLSPIDKSQVDINVTANQNFLLSLLPDFTSLDERQNMKFRLGVLNLLSDIKFGK